MQDYFLWNGVDCRTYGIHVTEQPPITIPAERSTQTNVPGRPGSLTQLEGEDVYDDMILTATCFISDPAQIPAIAAWKSSGCLPLNLFQWTFPGFTPKPTARTPT